MLTPSRDVRNLPFDDPERLDRAYLAAAYVAKNLHIQLRGGNIVNVDTWPNKTILMRCASQIEAVRYLELVNLYFARKKWMFKFFYPGGSIQEQS